jgi:hypothetical protein
MIDEVITSFAEQPNMRSKAIFQPAADVPERTTLDVLRDVVEPLIELRKASVYRRPTPACEKTTEPSETVGRQVNTRPEIIQRDPQYKVCRYNPRPDITDRPGSARRPDP